MVLPPAPWAVHNGLALYRFGQGPPLLFMPYPHGAAVAGDATFTALVQGLVDQGHEVATFDPPGSGQSPRPARLDLAEMLACAAETLAACDLAGPVDVLGHSQAGLVALALAVEQPALVDRLVLVCTAAGPTYLHAPGAIWRRGHHDYWRMGLPALLYRLTGRRAPALAMLNVIFQASYVDRAHFTPRRSTPRDWLRPAAPRLRWNLYARRSMDYRARLGAVRAPALVLAGRHDPQMPPACAAELARGLPHARLVVCERSGHYPFIEEPTVFWPTVRAFLDR